MNEMGYRPVVEPPDPAESFLSSDPGAAQAQAAVLLGIAWHLSQGDGGEFDEDVAEYTGIPLNRHPPEGARASDKDVLDRLERYIGGGTLEETCSRLFLDYRKQPEVPTAAALFYASFDNPDPLVRAAAAAGYLDAGTDPRRALAILRETAVHPAELVQAVARTSLARLAPELLPPDLLDLNYEGPGPLLETTLLVHGTFARTQAWWGPGGDFQDYLLTQVYTDVYNSPDAFDWSGVYSDAARVQGAADLGQWVTQRSRDAGMDHPVNLVTHSHGGSIAMLASWAPLPIARLVLLSCPVHRRKYYPRFDQIGETQSVRVHCDLVILADRGRQRFHDPRIPEIILPIWFTHSATHDPIVWQTYDVPSLLAAL